MNKKSFVIIIVGMFALITSITIYTKYFANDGNNVITDQLTENGFAIMVFDKSKNDYVKQDTYPVGAYRLNTEKSYCTNGTALGTYDSKTGTMTTVLNKPDKCNYFFDLGKITPTLTVAKNTFSYTDFNEYNSFTYNGDGIISCNHPYCVVDNDRKTISFNDCLFDTETITITASETDAYESVSTTFTAFTCLYPDTLIDYYDKKKKKRLKKKIEDIEEGDEVYTYSPETGAIELKKVKKVTTCKVKEAIALTIQGEELIIAKGHPVYVDGVGMLDVALVKEGYKLVGNDGIVYTVDKVEIKNFDEEQTMYNLLLEDGGNIIIGKAGILCLSLIMISLVNIKDVNAAGCPSTGIC